MNRISVRTKLLYMVSVLFGTGLFLLLGLFVAHQLWNIEINWGFAQTCVAFIQENSFNHAITNVAITILIFYSLIRMIFFGAKQLYRIRYWNRYFQVRTDCRLTLKMNRKYRKWNVPIIIVDSDSFIALTIGLIRPKVVISSWVLQHFSRRETEAILLHEAYHCRSYDPLKVFIITLLKAGFGFIPLFRVFHKQYVMGKELLADRYALDRMKTDFELSHVLLKLSQMQKQLIPAVGVPFVSEQSINYRIIQVLEPEGKYKLPSIKVHTVSVSFSMILFIGGLIIGGCS